MDRGNSSSRLSRGFVKTGTISVDPLVSIPIALCDVFVKVLLLIICAISKVFRLNWHGLKDSMSDRKGMNKIRKYQGSAESSGIYSSGLSILS